MSTERDTCFLDIMPVSTKRNIESEFTGKHDCKLITSLLSALHNYSSHAVVPLLNTSVFAAQPCWGLLCILNGNINVSKPLLCSDLHSSIPLDIPTQWFPLAADSAPSLALVQTCFQVSCLINCYHLTWNRIFDTDLKMPPVALP